MYEYMLWGTTLWRFTFVHLTKCTHLTVMCVCVCVCCSALLVWNVGRKVLGKVRVHCVAAAPNHTLHQSTKLGRLAFTSFSKNVYANDSTNLWY